MSWARLDDGMAFHEKIVEAGNAAVGVWVRMIAWSSQHLTDGCVPDHVAKLIAGGSRGALASLERSNLVLRRAESDSKSACVYVVHDYLRYNPSRAEILEKRERERERKSRSSARNPLGRDAASDPPIPSHPDPTPLMIDRGSEFLENLQAVEKVLYSRCGSLTGPQAAKFRDLLPVHVEEIEIALQTRGNSYAYLAKVIRSVREDRANGPPPGYRPKESFIERTNRMLEEEREAGNGTVIDAKDKLGF